MKTKEYEVKAFIIALECPACGSVMDRIYEDNTLVYFLNYDYKCNDCGQLVHLPKCEENQYPKLDYRKVE